MSADWAWFRTTLAIGVTEQFGEACVKSAEVTNSDPGSENPTSSAQPDFTTAPDPQSRDDV